MFSSIIKRANLLRPLITVRQSACSSLTNVDSVQANTQTSQIRKDRLFKKIRLEIRSHDPAVIRSYIKFTELAAENLNIPFEGVEYLDKYHTPKRSYEVERQTCLRSAFVQKKHREQYEWRTYIHFANFVNLTESTAETFLEYIERNLPEGCSMIVHKFEAVKMFEHLIPPMEGQAISAK